MVISAVELIQDLCQKKAPYARMAFLGGSQVNGHALPDSDYDILVISDVHPETGEPFDQPFSDHFTLPGHGSGRGGQVDFIVRTPAMFAYDVLAGRHCGYGLMMNLVAQGKIVAGDLGEARVFQNAVRAEYAKGPLPISRKDYNEAVEEIRALGKGVGQAINERNIPARDLLMLEWAHQASRLALRLSGHWDGRGKILARFMETHLPETKKQFGMFTLLPSCHQFRPGSGGEMAELLFTSIWQYADFEDILYKLITRSDRRRWIAPEDRENDFPRVLSGEMVCDRVLKAVRRDSRAFASLLHGQSPESDMLRNYCRYKLHMVRGCVTESRAAKPHYEYEYALARLYKEVKEFVLNCHAVTEPEAYQRHTIFERMNPRVVSAFMTALHQRNPLDLQRVMDQMLAPLGGPLFDGYRIVGSVTQKEEGPSFLDKALAQIRQVTR